MRTNNEEVLITYINKISKQYDVAGGIGANDWDWVALGQSIVDALEFIERYCKVE